VPSGGRAKYRAAIDQDPQRHEKVIREFRANSGRVGGGFTDMSLLLLHTVGVRSRLPRINPMAYLPDGEGMVVVASNAGKSTNPGWYHNLMAAGGGIVEVGDACIAVTAEVLTGAARAQWWPRLIDAIPRLEGWSVPLSREMPVILLRPARLTRQG
jgi:deazaflavin-dependent oxidoreductase (nitroreductase family)